MFRGRQNFYRLNLAYLKSDKNVEQGAVSAAYGQSTALRRRETTRRGQQGCWPQVGVDRTSTPNRSVGRLPQPKASRSDARTPGSRRDRPQAPIHQRPKNTPQDPTNITSAQQLTPYADLPESSHDYKLHDRNSGNPAPDCSTRPESPAVNRRYSP